MKRKDNEKWNDTENDHVKEHVIENLKQIKDRINHLGGNNQAIREGKQRLTRKTIRKLLTEKRKLRNRLDIQGGKFEVKRGTMSHRTD